MINIVFNKLISGQNDERIATQRRCHEMLKLVSKKIK